MHYRNKHPLNQRCLKHSRNLLLRAQLRENALVQRHAYLVVHRELLVKDTLHVAVGSQRLADVSHQSQLRVQLDRLEPLPVRGPRQPHQHVARLVEHVSHGGELAAHLEGAAGEHDLLEHHSVGGGLLDGAERHERQVLRFSSLTTPTSPGACRGSTSVTGAGR